MGGGWDGGQVVIRVHSVQFVMAVERLILFQGWSCYLISIVYFKLSLTCTDFWQRIVAICISKVSKSSMVSKAIGARSA